MAVRRQQRPDCSAWPGMGGVRNCPRLSSRRSRLARKILDSKVHRIAFPAACGSWAEPVSSSSGPQIGRSVSLEFRFLVGIESDEIVAANKASQGFAQGQSFRVVKLPMDAAVDPALAGLHGGGPETLEGACDAGQAVRRGLEANV